MTDTQRNALDVGATTVEGEDQTPKKRIDPLNDNTLWEVPTWARQTEFDHGEEIAAHRSSSFVDPSAYLERLDGIHAGKQRIGKVELVVVLGEEQHVEIEPTVEGVKKLIDDLRKVVRAMELSAQQAVAS